MIVDDVPSLLIIVTSVDVDSLLKNNNYPFLIQNTSFVMIVDDVPPL